MSKRLRADNDTDIFNDNDNDNELNNIPIHPLLQQQSTNSEIKNPINSDWRKRNRHLINPYINQSDISEQLKNFSKPKVQISINNDNNNNNNNKILEYSKKFRDDIKNKRIKQDKENELRIKNLIPNLKIGEDKYEIKEQPPYVEWWDEIYLQNPSKGDYKNKNYEGINSYIQHPVPIDAIWRKLKIEEKPLYLTKEEKRKLRKNRRMIDMKDKQDKIKLGLLEADKTKVKLKNLVNVLTNESIKNPTEIEMRVREEIKERLEKHQMMNLERKLNKDDKRDKNDNKIKQDILKGIYCLVFKIKRLINPKNIYKIDINAKQLGLFGICGNVRNGESIIIVEGGIKSIKKYRKLIENRINWQENEIKKGLEEEKLEEKLEDLSDNKCELIWEGEISEFKFRKWTMYWYDNESEIIGFLNKFGVDNFWRGINN